MNLLVTALLVSLLLNIVLFLIAFKQKSDKLTDASYATTFVLLTLLGITHANSITGFHTILTLMILLWAIRIGGFLLIRVMKTGKDSRFDAIREDFFKFGKFWIGQAITVWLVLLPALFAYGQDGKIIVLSWCGIVIWIVGFTIESLADIQKYRFSTNPENNGHWIESGIWRYSRHPNYFGEILVWIGVYCYTLDALSGFEKLAGLVRPLFICILLLFVSGIPILEAAADKRWGKLKAYQTYKKRTSILIPLPRHK